MGARPAGREGQGLGGALQVAGNEGEHDLVAAIGVDHSEHERLHDLTDMNADGSGSLGGRAGGLLEMDDLDRDSEAFGGLGDPGGVGMHGGDRTRSADGARSGRPASTVLSPLGGMWHQRELSSLRHESAVEVPDLGVDLEESAAHEAGAELTGQPTRCRSRPHVGGELDRRCPRNREPCVEHGRRKGVDHAQEADRIDGLSLAEPEPSADERYAGRSSLEEPGVVRVEPELDLAHEPRRERIAGNDRGCTRRGPAVRAVRRRSPRDRRPCRGRRMFPAWRAPADRSPRRSGGRGRW